MAMDIEANDLVLFARIADAGSFSRGAERAGQPRATASRRIAALEKELGERLFLRTTRRLALTEFGTSLLEHAHRLNEEVEAATALAQFRQAEPGGKLRVSVPGDFAFLLLPAMLASFIKRFPGVELELDLSPRRVDLIGEGFDLAIRIGDLPDDATLVARRLCELSGSLYASPAYLDAHGRPGNPDELAGHRCLRLLARSGDAAPWELEQAGKRWAGEVARSFKANSPGLLMQLALEDAGIALLVDHFAEPLVASGALEAVLPGWRARAATAWAVLPGRRLLPAKTRAFVEALVAALDRPSGNPSVPLP